MEGYKTDHSEFNKDMSRMSKDFYKMIDLNPESLELKTLVSKYETWQEELFDPAYVIGIVIFCQ